jgi:hypothetical protein
MRMLIAFCAITLATACTSNPVQPQQVVEVKVPVPVPCVDKAEDVPKTAMPDPDASDTAQLAAGAVTDSITYRLYAEKSHALLVQCAKPQEATP